MLICIRLWTGILRSLTFLMKCAQAYLNPIKGTSAGLNLQKVKDIGPFGKPFTRCQSKLLQRVRHISLPLILEPKQMAFKASYYA